VKCRGLWVGMMLESRMPDMHRAGSRVILSGLRMQSRVADVLSSDARFSRPAVCVESAVVRKVSSRSRVLPPDSSVGSNFSSMFFAISNVFREGSRVISCETRLHRASQAWEGKSHASSCGKDACNDAEHGCPAKEQPCNRVKNHETPLWMRRAARFKHQIRKNTREMLKKNHGITGIQTPVDRAQACPSKHPDGYIEALF
jgi:hypothetical protein